MQSVVQSVVQSIAQSARIDAQEDLRVPSSNSREEVLLWGDREVLGFGPGGVNIDLLHAPWFGQPPRPRGVRNSSPSRASSTAGRSEE